MNKILKTIAMGMCSSAILLLSGCYDMAETYEVNYDGSGNAACVLILNEDVGRDDIEDQSFIDGPSLLRRWQTNPQGRDLLIEAVKFDQLGDITLEWGSLATRYEGDSLMITRGFPQKPLSSDDMDMARIRFLSNYYNLRLSSSQKVLRAEKIYIEGKTIYPEVDGNGAVYRIYFPDLMAHLSKKPLSVTVSFKD